MHPSRGRDAAAVLFSGVCAPTIESRNGSASETPAPRRNVRRDKCFFVMKFIFFSTFAISSASTVAIGLGPAEAGHYVRLQIAYDYRLKPDITYHYKLR